MRAEGRLIPICRTVAVFLVCGTIAMAQEVGDVVSADTEVNLKVEDDVVATAAEGDQLTVRKVQGKWLWVENADGQRGWVEKRRVTVVEPDTPPDRPAAGGDADSDSEDSPWLLTIGVLAGQNIYTTYSYIGTVADGYANEHYTGEQTRELMREVVGLSDIATEHLQAVRDTNIIESDKEAIDDIVEIFGLLKNEATALSDFTESGAQEDLDAYEEARTTVWPRIKSVLQIE